MIVSSRGDRLLVVRQVDHQVQCGLMARAWGNATFAPVECWESLIVAAERHDEGWREWDDAPRVGEDGAPVDFPEIDRSEHVELYARGIDAAVARDRRAGLVVSMHGQGLHESRLGLDGAPRSRERQATAVRAFLEREEVRQGELRREIGDSTLSVWAWDAYRLLQAWDLLSLYLLWYGLPKALTGTLARVPRAAGDPGEDIVMEPDGDRFCVLRPFPFAGDEVVLPVAARLIPNRRYSDDDDLREVLAGAQWITHGVGARRHRAT